MRLTQGLLIKYLLLDIGDYTNETTAEQVVTGDAATIISDFNQWLLDLLVYAGAIIIAIGIVKLVMALQQQDTHQKMQAAMMFGLGAMFVASNTIITILNITGESTPEEVVRNMASITGSVLRLVAIILLAIAVFQMILSLVNEDVSQKVEASKLLAISSVLYAIKSVLVIVSMEALDRDVAGITSLIIGIVVTIARFIGVIMCAYGLYQIILAIKDQDSSQWQKNAIIFTAGVILFYTPVVLDAIGINYTAVIESSVSGTGQDVELPPIHKGNSTHQTTQ